MERARVTFSKVSRSCVTSDRLHQVGHQIGAPLQLHVDAGPGLARPHSRADEAVVDAEHYQRHEDNDPDDDG
jgi:hypothetical protein